MDEELKQIDEVVALYKGPKSKNRDVIREILRDLDGWALERGFDLQAELDYVRQSKVA